ncbi:MAG: beta-L-arabinofuranosidase domain-containing protein [Candidatus Hermodarchaeota archaeon]
MKKLQPLLLKPLKLGEIKPTGWLRMQLLTQFRGLSGHLDEFWPDVKDSGWIGGKAEDWERFPYWLDGVIPLAYLTDSKSLVERIEGYINYILNHQQEDGWIGPVAKRKSQRYDPWPNMVVCKALIQYFEISKNNRVIPTLLKYYHKLEEILNTLTLGESWAKMRWMDAVWGIHWLIDYLEDEMEVEFLLKLAEKLRYQGYNWKEHFENFYYVHMRKNTNQSVIYSKDLSLDGKDPQAIPESQYRRWDMRSHVVNNAMGIKASTIWSRQSGLETDKNAIFTAISTLDEYHGQATGMFSGDEHLAGKNPSQGTELCAVMEYLFSLETTIPIIGCNSKGVQLIDRMEQICFNAVPATFLPDMWAHQYVQQVNQIQAKVVPQPIYTTNSSDANIYGLEPCFGCCTANMHQGWPKFVEYGLWARDEEGLVCLAYSPCKLSTYLSVDEKDVPIEVEEKTFYPFSNKVEFLIHLPESVDFAVKLRIPEWCDVATIQINGESSTECVAGKFIKLLRRWRDNDHIILQLTFKVRYDRRYNDAITLFRGSLVFSYTPKEEKKEIKHYKTRNEVKDWEVYPKTKWNFGLIEPFEPMVIELQENMEKIDSFNADYPPVKIKIKAVEISNWVMEYEAVMPPPLNPMVSSKDIEEIELIPYGCTNIRITEFPTVNKRKFTKDKV